MTIYMDTTSNFHPYECDGPGKCEHCDRIDDEHHNPDKCSLCIDRDYPVNRGTPARDLGGYAADDPKRGILERGNG